MSLAGATKVNELDDRLRAAIASKNSEKAKALIEEIISLGIDPQALQSPRVAARKGLSEIFASFLQKGFNPFLPDEAGFSCFYYARTHKRNSIVDLIQSFYKPVLLKVLDQPEGQDLNYDLELALLDCGFHPYWVEPVEVPKAHPSQIIQVFINLLNTEGTLPLFEKEKERKAKEKSKHRKKKNDEQDKPKILISPQRLTQMAAGTIEEIQPHILIDQFNVMFPTLKWHQTLCCIFLIKEWIRLDANKEWIESSAFQKAFRGFVDKLNIKTSAMAKLRLNLVNFYESRVSQNYLKSPVHFAKDLTKAFYEAFMAISPMDFIASNLLDAKAVDTSFIRFSKLSTHVSRLVILDILKGRHPKEIAKVFEFYIHMAGWCLEETRLKALPDLAVNIPAGFAIVTGLVTLIKRLPKAWELVASDMKNKLASYREIFELSDNFSALRAFHQQNPGCIPALNVFSKDKMIIQDSDPFNRLVRNGEANLQFLEFKQNLSRLAYLSLRPYTTHLMSEIQKVSYFSDEDFEAFAYKQGCLIEPPQVITLDANLNQENLIRILKDCKTLSAPLAVRDAAGVLFMQGAAKRAIESFIPADYHDRVLPLCDEVISTFEGTEDLTVRFAEMTLEAPRKRKLSIEERGERLRMNYSATRSDLHVPTTKTFAASTPLPSSYTPRHDSLKQHKSDDDATEATSKEKKKERDPSRDEKKKGMDPTK